MGAFRRIIDLDLPSQDALKRDSVGEVRAFPSSSSSKVYEVRRHKDGYLWCTCPSWKFKKLAVEDRSCKHTHAVGRR